jgi:hypothetical protein
MMMGFGFCPNCGTPRVAAEQRFCAGCGLALAAASPPAPQAPVPIAAPVSVSSDLTSPIPPPPASEPIAAAEAPADPPPWAVEKVVQPVEAPSAPPPWAAQPVAPPAWSMPPAAAPTAPPWAVPPPAPGAPTAQAVAPGTPASAPAPTPRAPGTPIATVAGIKVTPKLLAIGGIALAVIAVVVYMATSSKADGITFAPSTFSCSSSAQVTKVMQLPSSMKATDRLSWQEDGVSIFTNTVTDTFKQQTDGTSNCQGPSGPLSMGTHSIRILDVSGRGLAEGSFTLTP